MAQRITHVELLMFADETPRTDDGTRRGDDFEASPIRIRPQPMNGTKPYEIIGFGAMDVTNACEFIGFQLDSNQVGLMGGF